MTVATLERASAGVLARPSQHTGCDVPDNLPDMARLAELLNEASMLPKHFQGSPANVMVAMLKARALDVPMMAALENIYIVNGTASISSALAHTLAERAGYQIRITESTSDKANARLIRPDGTFEDFTYTIAEAKVAGLSGKDIWVKNPRDMLIHRAVGKLVRLHAPQVTMGMSIQDIGDDITDAPTAISSPADGMPDDSIGMIMADLRDATTVDQVRDLYGSCSASRMLSHTHQGRTVKEWLLEKAEQLKTATTSSSGGVVEMTLFDTPPPAGLPPIPTGPAPVTTTVTATVIPDTKSPGERVRARAAKLAEKHSGCSCDPQMLAAGDHAPECAVHD